MRLLLLLFLALMHLQSAHAGVIEEGYELLEAGDLEGATALWESALETGEGSATLHYNLGTTWYRQGNIARAIAHWRMGRILRPRDANLVHNLAVARSELQDVVEPVDSQPSLLQVATVSEWGLLGSLLLGLASLGLWLPLAQRRLGKWPPLATGVVGLLLVWVSVNGSNSLRNHPGAVIAEEGAFLRKLAVRHSDVVSRLAPGTEVGVERVHQGFALVHTSGETRGWIPVDAVLFVGKGWNLHP